MKSIKLKLVILTISTVAITTVTVGAIGVEFSMGILKTQASHAFEAETEVLEERISGKLDEIETLGNSIEGVLYNELPDDIAAFSADPDAINTYIEQMKTDAIGAVDHNNYDDCIMYLRFNPNIFGDSKGFYVQRSKGTGEYRDVTFTDLTQYTADDIDKVGWYYEPLKAGHATWLARIHDQNTGNKLLTYVIPLYKNGYFVGVFGIDVELNLLDNYVESFTKYESGMALLLSDDGELVCHSLLDTEFTEEQVDAITTSLLETVDFSETENGTANYSYGGKNYLVNTTHLDNDMIFVTSVCTREIYRDIQRLVYYTVGVAVAFIVIISIISSIFADKIIKPLHMLTSLSEKIARRENIGEISIKGDEEVEQLANQLKKTSEELDRYTSIMSKMAYRDGLTGLKNKSSYLDDTSKIDSRIDGQIDTKYTVFVMDINNLKYTNDNFGHEMGDTLIIDASNLIEKVFGDEYTYRIGGDEFVAIARDNDYENTQKLMKKFKDEMKHANEEKHEYGTLSVAIGSATYHNGDSFESLFTRADRNMYKNKRNIKNGEEIR